MPIDFPTSPATGQTYSYGINRWIYNGVAWDKIDNHPGICGGNQILINYTEGFNGATFQVNVIEGKGSDLDSDLIHGVSGSRFLEHLQSGLLYGATLAVNAGNTAYFDLSAGAGIIVNFGATLSNYPNPTVSLVTWPSRTGLTAQYIATHHETWLSIDSSGNIIQQATKWSDQQYESRIPIGVLIHPNHTTINLAVDIPKLSYGNATQVDPFMRAFGPLKLSGHEISANGANLQVNKSSGTAFLLGGNYTTDPNYANVVTDTNATPISTIYHYYRDVSGEFISTISAFIDPTKYDDGSGTLATAPSGKYTTQRLFFLPGTPTVLAAYYGREIYNSIETAQANIQFESFSEDDSTASLGVFGGYLIVKANATALNNSADAKFISSGIFRNLANIGGGGVAVAGLDDLTDVVITSASNNQVLKYESGFWINSGLTSSIGNYVTTFNGLTGAVTGVTTSVANTFTALQTFNAGLSATGITLDGTLEINKRPISFSGSSVNLLNGVPGLVLQGATTGYASRIVINSNENDGTTASIDLIPYNGNVYIRKGEYEDGGIQAAGDWKSSLYLEENQLFGGIHYGILTVPGNLSADRTLTFPNDSGTIALTKNVVSSVNGSTGAIQVVSSFNGRTGAVQGVSAAFGGTGISVSGSTGSITISNTGVLSFNGLTGSVTGVGSIRGLTGAVGITNGSGIGLSVSGNTLTFSNTGVLSVNGSTGSVVTYAGTTGNIQFRYNNGVTANNYFTLVSGDFSEITDVLSLSGPTSSLWYYGNQEAIGLQIIRGYNGFGFDESGGVEIKVLGIGNDVVDTYSSNLKISTPPNTAGGGAIILDAGGDGGAFAVTQNGVSSIEIHEFGSGINSYNLASTNTFAGPIIAAGATFSSLARFNAGISAAGATLSGNIGIPSGSTLTVGGNLVGATATFINGNFTLRQNSLFGITASNNIKQIVQHQGIVSHSSEYYSYYSSSTTLTNQTIAVLPLLSSNVIIKSTYSNVPANEYIEYISNFTISVYTSLSSTVVDWTETKTFYTGSLSNVPIYNVAVVSGNIHISVSQTLSAKIGSLVYKIIAKAT